MNAFNFPVERDLTLDSEVRYEWVDGELREKPAMGAKANRVATVLVSLLNLYAFQQRLGLVFSQECGYQIFSGLPKKLRKPDASFIARGRLPNDEPPDGHVKIAPDLVVEVVSPNDLAEEIEARIDDYLGAGVRLLWVLYPSTRTVHVYRKDGTGARLAAEQALSGEDVVPGFSTPVQDLFVPF